MPPLGLDELERDVHAQFIHLSLSDNLSIYASMEKGGNEYTKKEMKKRFFSGGNGK